MFVLNRDRAFTLVELLIVVVVLGILAGIVLPSFTSSTEDTKVSATVQNLQTIRAALDLYKVQHNDKYPGYPVGGGTPTQALATDQLILASKADGSTAAPGTAGFGYGPYIRERLPENPINGRNDILIVLDGAAFPAADNTTGWIYQPQLGKVRANSTGTAPSGRNYYDF